MIAETALERERPRGWTSSRFIVPALPRLVNTRFVRHCTYFFDYIWLLSFPR